VRNESRRWLILLAPLFSLRAQRRFDSQLVATMAVDRAEGVFSSIVLRTFSIVVGYYFLSSFASTRSTQRRCCRGKQFVRSNDRCLRSIRTAHAAAYCNFFQKRYRWENFFTTFGNVGLQFVRVWRCDLRFFASRPNRFRSKIRARFLRTSCYAINTIIITRTRGARRRRRNDIIHPARLVHYHRLQNPREHFETRRNAINFIIHFVFIK
jgi:hypothetical protein